MTGTLNTASAVDVGLFRSSFLSLVARCWFGVVLFPSIHPYMYKDVCTFHDPWTFTQHLSSPCLLYFHHTSSLSAFRGCMLCTQIKQNAHDQSSCQTKVYTNKWLDSQTSTIIHVAQINAKGIVTSYWCVCCQGVIMIPFQTYTFTLPFPKHCP